MKCVNWRYSDITKLEWCLSWRNFWLGKQWRQLSLTTGAGHVFYSSMKNNVLTTECIRKQSSGTGREKTLRSGSLLPKAIVIINSKTLGTGRWSPIFSWLDVLTVNKFHDTSNFIELPLRCVFLPISSSTLHLTSLLSLLFTHLFSGIYLTISSMSFHRKRGKKIFCTFKMLLARPNR